MLSTCVHLQFAHLGTAEAVLGDHACNSLLHCTLGELLKELFVAEALETTRVVGVAVGALLFQLVAGQHNLVRVDDDDKVTRVDVRCEFHLVLAAQQTSCLLSKATENDVSGVDDVPLALDIAGLWCVRTQKLPSFRL